MVLFKRKPVQFLPPAEVEDEDEEVWHIPQTGEIFTSYEEYLNRMDFYKQRRFNDQITGHSGLTFFEAYNSELTGGREVEASFPESLKGPILRKVQFQTISRLDNLVDILYDDFKDDYYPGEAISVAQDDGEKYPGVIREKTTFGARILPDGSHSAPTSRYLVVMKSSGQEAVVKAQFISRDRGIFTKSMLRSFIKKTVVREAWNGAPWLVKHDYANLYHIDTRIPPHLRYDTKVQERKRLQTQKRNSLGLLHDVNGQSPTVQSGPVRLPELKPAPKSQKPKVQNGLGSKGLKWPVSMATNGTNGAGYPGQYSDQRLVPRDPTPRRSPTPTPPPPPPPPPKYPIEDLLLEPKVASVRPPLRFMCSPPDAGNKDTAPKNPIYEKIEMDTVGLLLETWDTLNVYCEIFKLDSFTFDDFVEAMAVASNDVSVQLFDEIHCSVLKILVDSEPEGGKVRIILPELEEDGSDEEGEDAEEEGSDGEETPKPENIPVARATRSSLAKMEAERLAAEAAAAEEETLRAELETKHRAEELLKEYDWIDHLRKREFLNGGWERIMVGLLHQLSKNERHRETCEELLLLLVPPETEPSQENVQQQYAKLDINHRVKALQIICMLTMETKAIRGYMEDCSETMTKYRKDKIEWQRQRKQASEELRQLNEQRKALMPENEPAAQQENGTPTKKDEDVKMAEPDDSLVDDKEDEEIGDSMDEGHPRKKRRSRIISDKLRKREEEEQERKARERAKEAARPKMSKKYIKLLKDIQKKEEIIKQCEEEVAIIENDLREADCPRTRVLGKDRFWNRYYWFERNGMPYAGLPDSSTASAGYANGCIWVQGPDDLEREGYIEVPDDLQDEYRAKFDMSIPERKRLEEGETSVYTARQWGYISDAEDVDKLIRWLDPRGFNELKLRKELLAYREKIATHMNNRKAYLSLGDDDDHENNNNPKSNNNDKTDKEGDAEGQGVDVDTDKDKEDKEAKNDHRRHSSRVQERLPEPTTYRCMTWENTMALEELGHLHGMPPPPPRPRKQAKKREAAGEPAARPAKTRRR
ncbi:Imitation switch two complex protein 1 [Escovopsis weberi]|uniref:Imitation switch two complex protein 1 n=1 Tax=Escovopsis weberi TaxID=150374 RepID=A0A0M8MYI2_ESCWE|nr:Imitation switch two complex protein 1 [Escovopsis weberi]